MTQDPQKDIDQLCINTIRTLVMDAVQQANSSHPGSPMGMAPIVYGLWQQFLRFDPDDPLWPNCDRFVLSSGHCSMLLYALLHLTGVKAVNPQYELANLCWIYDNNRITIEGHTALTFSEDVATRFLGYGWNVTRVGDANDLEMLARAFTRFKHAEDGPTLIIVDSHIAYGAPHKEDTSAAHGEPLGAEEIKLTKRTYGWPEGAQFLVPDGVRAHFEAEFGQRGRALRDAWTAQFEAYGRQYPELADEASRMFHRQLPDGWDQDLPSFPVNPKGLASRDASGQVLVRFHTRASHGCGPGAARPSLARSLALWERARVRESTVGRESTVLPCHQYLDSGIASGPYQANEKESIMKAAAPLQLREAGQSLWLDNITRDLLTSGTLKRYIDELSITGLTSNPTIFDHAITKSQAYDAAIRQNIRQGMSDEELFFELVIEDLTQAADLFRPIYDATDGVDGWVSLEVSPLLAYDTAGTIAQAKELHARAGRPNLFIKIPGTKEGLPAIEEAIFAGVPVNVTLLFSRGHYVAAADAYMRGIERRIAAGLNSNVRSVASVFISRWDKAVTDKTPHELRDQLGIAVANRTYRAYRGLLDSNRFQRLANAGARTQRLLWASTGVKDPEASDHPLHHVARGSEYGQHDARGHAAGIRQPRGDRPLADG